MSPRIADILLGMFRRSIRPAWLAFALACAACKFPALPEIVDDAGSDASDSDAFTLPIDAPPPLCDVSPCVVQISAGGAHSCARIDDGTVRCWGLNGFGECGGGTANPPMDGGIDEYVLPRNYSTPNVVTGLPTANRALVIGAGGAYRSDGISCAAMDDMQMWCWGIDKSQQLGRGGATRLGDISNPVPARPVPAPVVSIRDVKDISVGVRNACAVFQSGSVACWGSDTRGALGITPVGNTYGQPQTIAIPQQVQRVVMRGQHALALTTGGEVWAWGDNADGQCAVDPTTTVVMPRKVSELAGSYVDVAAGRHFSCAVDAAGNVWCWGQGSRGQLGRGATPPANDHRPALVTFPVAGTEIVQISGDEQHMLALARNGTVYEWGKVLAEMDPVPVLYSPTVITLPEPAIQVTAGYQHSCALLDSGAVWCWGNNLDAELGRGPSGQPDVLQPGPVVF